MTKFGQLIVRAYHCLNSLNIELLFATTKILDCICLQKTDIEVIFVFFPTNLEEWSVSCDVKNPISNTEIKILRRHDFLII